MPKRPHKIQALALLVAATAGIRPALAEEADVCIASYEKSQVLRKQGRFLEAQQELLACARMECPELARKDCTQWRREVEESTPSVVFLATDREGHEVLALRVLVDGVELLPRLDGKARPVDPGIHMFRYETAEGEPIEQQVVMHEGEKNRIVSITIPAPVPARPPEVRRSSPPGGAYVLAGIGAAGIASFALFGAFALHDRNHLRDSCAPHCDNADVSKVRTELVVANVSLGIGVAAAAAAGWMLFFVPRRDASVVFGMKPAAGGAMGALEGRF
jgi:hypothetical protein